MLISLNKVLVLLLAAGFAVAGCGKKKKNKEIGQVNPPNSYIPADWDYKSDWSGSPLKAKDILL